MLDPATVNAVGADHGSPRRLVLDAGGRRGLAGLAPDDREALAFHRTLAGYRPTPLHAAPELARELGAAEVWVKDETERLELPAFKVLGAAWAIDRLLGGDVAGRTLVAASDGNHGRAVARLARLLGARAEIFMPAGTAAARIAAIEFEGAQVTVVEAGYDAAVARAAACGRSGATVIADVATEPGDRAAWWVVDGYSTIFWEVDEQLAAAHAAPLDVVVVQMGVGALTAAAIRHHLPRGAARPVFVGVEPVSAACVMASLAAGGLASLTLPQVSVMVGLNCGTPSTEAWPYLRAGLDVCVAVDDAAGRRATARMAAAGIRCGETGAAGLAGAAQLAADPGAAHWLAGKRVLLIATEGVTDPVSHAESVAVPADLA